MRTTRTFIALELSSAVRQCACDLVERLKASDVPVNWVAPESMHLTLKFLGDQTDTEVALVCRTVIESVKGVVPFEFMCRGAGAFPNCQRPRTLWIGLRDGEDAVRQLHQRIEDPLAELGFGKERRAYHPHLTLGRVRASGAGVEELGRLVEKAEQFQLGTVRAEQVVVYGSFLHRGGPRYEVMARASFRGK